MKAGQGRETARRLGWEQLIFLAASPLVLARFAHEIRGYAAPAPGSTKPPCYAGYDVNNARLYYLCQVITPFSRQHCHTFHGNPGRHGIIALLYWQIRNYLFISKVLVCKEKDFQFQPIWRSRYAISLYWFRFFTSNHINGLNVTRAPLLLQT